MEEGRKAESDGRPETHAKDPGYGLRKSEDPNRDLLYCNAASGQQGAVMSV